MRRNTRKSKPNPSNNQRQNIRTSSVRDIIGDRRFNDQFRNVNTHGTEGSKKVKRIKVWGDETDDLPNSGRNSSSIQCEATQDPTHFAAKTSEFAFFKRLKENTCSGVHVHPTNNDYQLNNAQQSDHFTSREIPNVQKERNDTNYSYLSTPSPCCRTKNSGVKDVYGTNTSNAQHTESNWLSPSVDRKTKTSGNKGVFSAKREKLCKWIAEKSSYDINELSSKGLDLVSALINRILPEDQKNNSRILCEDETNIKHKLPYFSESEAYERKSNGPHHTLYLDDYFSRSRKRPMNMDMDMDLLEWVPTGRDPESSIQYNNYFHTEESYNKRKLDSYHISYPDDHFSRSNRELIMGSNSNIEYSYQFDEESYFCNRPKLLELPNTLLLGWEHNDKKHELQLSAQTEINMFSTSPPSSPYIHKHLKKQHLLTSSMTSPPDTPKHLIPVEDCAWRMNDSVNSEAFVFLIESPANNLLKFLNTDLHSFVVDDEKEDKFRGGSDRLLETYCDRRLDRIEYPLLLHDSSWNDEF